MQSAIEKLKRISEDFTETKGCAYDGAIITLVYKLDDVIELLEKQAKADAVPDVSMGAVILLKDVQSKIAQASFLTMDADNENEVYAVDANELAKYIDDLIEAQESNHD